jgi:catechol 2,3-dioxygenase-like lactoylglutathione lyase family enzyme
MLRTADQAVRIELGRFVRPDHGAGAPNAMANELGLRNVCFEVEDLQGAVDKLATDGYELVGGIGEWENTWKMAYVRGPDGIVVALAEQLG